MRITKRTRRHIKRMLVEFAVKGTITVSMLTIIVSFFCISVKAQAVTVTQIPTETFENPMAGKYEPVPEKEPISAEEFCDMLNEVCGTEAFYVESEGETESHTENEEVAEVGTEDADIEADVLLLAQLMHAEEGILRYKLSYEEAKLAHMYAGSVVLHRRNMHYRGAETIKDVIYTRGQYASVNSLNQEVPEETIEWARELIVNGPLGPENMIYQAQFEQGSYTVAHIGNQYFCAD